MLLSLLPTTVFAAGTDKATVDGTQVQGIGVALQQAENGSTITLLGNVSWKGSALNVFKQAKNSNSLTINLNGYKLTVDKNIVVEGGALTITDTAGDGSINSTANQMFNLKAGGSLTINGGTFASKNATNATKFVNGTTGTTITGGTFFEDVSEHVNATVAPYTVMANKTFSYYSEWNEAYAAYESSGDAQAKIASTGSIGRDKVQVTLDYGYDGEQDTYATTVGSTIVLPTLQRDGYQHTGWTFGGNSYAPGEEVPLKATSSKTFVAQWSNGDRTVTYLDAVTGAKKSVAVMNGSQIVMKETHGTDRNIDIQEDYTLENPARDGYTFLGWVYTIDTNNSNRHTFTARWAQNVNLGEVAYDAVTDKSERLNTQDSSGSYTSTSKTYSYFTVEKDSDSYFTVTPKGNLAAGETYTETIYLTKKGDSSFVAAYQVSVTVTSATATPSFAHNGQYAVEVGESKETKLDNLPTGATVAYTSSDSNIATVSKNGTITGVSAGTATITATITAENYTDMTATCTVTVNPQKFTIVIDPQNGDEAVTRPGTVSAGEKVPEPAGGPYTKDGCEFLGWSLNQDATTEEEVWNFDNPVTAEADWDKDGIITFYAVYAPVYYTVTFNLDGGTLDGKERVDSQRVQQGAQIANPGKPEKDGYIFQGWAYNSEGYTWAFDTPDWKVQGDLTLTAKWEPIDCTVTFNANGGRFMDGTTTHTRDNVKYGTALAPVSENPKQDGHSFLGWSVNADAETPDWVFDTGVSSTATPTPVTEKNLTLYAVWSANPCEITYTGTDGENATANVGYGTTITIDPNGGEYDDNNSFTSDGSKTNAFAITVRANITLASPTRDGYTFTGWAYNADNHRFAAKWEEIQYTVTLDANGGTIYGGKDLTRERSYAESIGPIPASEMQRNGYTFLGWAFGKDAETARYDAADKMSVQDIVSVAAKNGLLKDNAVTLYAVWEAKTYTFHLDANGGTVYGMDVLTKEKQCTDTLGPVNDQMEYDGHTFLGWAASEDAGAENVIYGPTEKMQCSELASEGHFTLYAVWDVDQLTVSYSDNGGEKLNATATMDYGTTITIDPNGGVYDDNDSYKDQTDAFTYTVEANITLANPTRDGYTFTGWAYNADNHRFAAKWKAIQYTVTLDANGGKIYGNDTLTREKPYSGTLGPVPVNEMQRAGYTFLGWAFDQTANEAFYGPAVKMTYADIFSHLTEKTRTSVTLYAVWTPNTYTLTYDANGGTFNGKETEIRQDSVGVFFDQKFSVKKTADAYKGLAREGYTFLGWALNAASEEPVYRPGDMIHYTWQQDITLYAVWSQNMYTVTFDANGGEGTMTTQTFQACVPEALNKNTFTRTNYHFVGWSENADAAQADIQDGQTFTFADQDRSRTLYAIWALDTYDFTYYKYNADGRGNAIDTTIQVTHGSQYYVNPNGGTYYGQSNKYAATVTEDVGTRTLDNTATRPGYTFDGWRYYKNGNTYVAQWKANPYTVTFKDSISGEVYATQTVTGGMGFDPLGIASPDGKQFLGWYLEGAAEPYDCANTPVTGDITLYAVWEDVEYTVTFIGNGGSNEYRDQNYPVTVPYNKALDLTQVPAFTRQGYVFLGWSTQRNHAVDYAASVTTLQVNGDMTLYAVWAQVVDFGTIPYGTGEQHVKTIDYQNGIVNVTNQGDFNAVLDGNDSSRLMISPANDMAPSNEVYSTIMRVDFDKNNMTQYVQAMVKISQQEMEISTNMSEVEYYTVGDSFTVYVTAAPGQNLTLDVGNAADALKCTQELHEVEDGVYTAVYEVVSIPSDAQKLQFTVTDAFGNTADYQETINLRTEVIVTVNNVDETQISIPTMYLGTDEDSGNSKQLPLTWNEGLGKYTALADKASGWDYVYFQTADGREVFLRNTTVASESITEGIQANDGLVEVEYTFGGYTIAGNLYINDVAVPNVSLRISGNYGDAVNLQQLINQAWQPIVDRYPNAKTDKFDISVLLNGSPVQIKTFGETNYDWGSDNTIYVNVYATAGYHVDYDLNWQDDSNDVVYTEFVKHGETATGYANPSREGFKFAGWYVDPACTTAYDFTQPVTNNMILYAKWEANVYLVQFNNGYGGIYEEGTPWAPQEIPYNGILSKPTEVPTRPGYTFNGWYLDPEGTKGCFNENGQCVVTTDMVIYAGWKQNDYWLVYHNVDLASNKDQFQDYEIHYGDVIRQPVDPIQEGYTFQGWYLDEACTEPATFPITVGEKQVDLYAKWVEAVTVTFNLNGGTSTDDADGDGTFTLEIAKGSALPDTLATPTHPTFVFGAWYADADQFSDPWNMEAPINESMTLTAGWEKATGVGKFFNTTQTSTYVMIRVQDANGNWQPATGIEDLTLSAKNQNGPIFDNVHMQEILPESPNWQSDWDPDYAYYTASFASTPLTGSGQFALTAAGYDFTVSV